MIFSRFFSDSEFKRAVPPCSLNDMNQTTMIRMDRAREFAGIPFVVNSAFRTPEHEKLQGRDGKSSHTTGRALDIRCNTPRNRFLIIDALLKAGFTRIGVAQTFIHADDSPSHDQKVVWFY